VLLNFRSLILQTIDTSERDRAVQELEQEREARKKAEMEAARARLNYQMALAECNQMKQAIEQQKQQIEVFRSVFRDAQNACLIDRISKLPD